MEDKELLPELKIEYRNNTISFYNLKISAYLAEGLRLISNLLKKGLHEIDKELKYKSE